MHTNGNVTSMFFFIARRLFYRPLHIARPHIVNRIHRRNKMRIHLRRIKIIRIFHADRCIYTKKNDDSNFANMAKSQLQNNHVNKSVTANECTPIKNVVPNTFWKSFVSVGVQTDFDTDSKFGITADKDQRCWFWYCRNRTEFSCIQRGYIAYTCKFIHFDTFFLLIQ